MAKNQFYRETQWKANRITAFLPVYIMFIGGVGFYLFLSVQILTFRILENKSQKCLSFISIRFQVVFS